LADDAPPRGLHYAAQHARGRRHITRRQALVALFGVAVAALIEAGDLNRRAAKPSLQGLSSNLPAAPSTAAQSRPPWPTSRPPDSFPGGSLPSGNPTFDPPLPGSAPSSAQAPPVTVNQPGPPEVIFGGDPLAGTFALTFDDGTCSTCAAEIVAAVQGSGLHATFSPNGYMGAAVWDSQAEAIAAMAASGQVSLCNHTWDHQDLTKLNAGQIRTELLRNEDWIQERFGVSSRPFYRPPYGFHSLRVDEVAGNIGFTKVIMWNGTFGDSIVHPPEFILQQLKEYLKPGTIMLGHANHPATASIMDEIIEQILESRLRPVTLVEMLGTEPRPKPVGASKSTTTTDIGGSRSTTTSTPTTTTSATTTTTARFRTRP
jgi:peptidoglycan/xylan/chitin deacetylase (PgdA/CDA1 family)